MARSGSGRGRGGCKRQLSNHEDESKPTFEALHRGPSIVSGRRRGGRCKSVYPLFPYKLRFYIVWLKGGFVKGGGERTHGRSALAHATRITTVSLLNVGEW